MLKSQDEKDNMLLVRLITSILIAIGIVFNMPVWYKCLILAVGAWGLFSIIMYNIKQYDSNLRIALMISNCFVYLLYAFYHSLPFALKVVAVINFVLDNIIICYSIAFKDRNPIYFLISNENEDEDENENENEKEVEKFDNDAKISSESVEEREDISKSNEDLFYDPYTCQWFYTNKDKADELEDKINHIGEQYIKVTNILNEKYDAEFDKGPEALGDSSSSSSSISCKSNLQITFRPAAELICKDWIGKDICFKSIEEMDEWIARRDIDYHPESGYCHMPLGPSKFDEFTYCVYGTNNEWKDMVALGFFKVEYV